jgi:mono/diheme cytochrome c family protein
MKRHLAVTLAAASALAVVAGASPVAHAKGESKQVARGRYLVTVIGCNDCHTPLKMGPNGPEPDLTRLLSGHPEALKMPPAPKLAMPWGAAMAATMTAFAGPWGTSFAANLTPDETGIARWTEQDFIQTARSGRHLGRGRPILPPMPIQNLGQMTDDDLKAMFAYLKSIPAVKNEVPQALPPELASH